MLLVRVAAEKALPFDVKIPNATTVKAMRAADEGKGKRPHAVDLRQCAKEAIKHPAK
jgi:DNA-damage-inducible protein J